MATAKSPRIAIVVDNPFRDLQGLVLTAWELCQRGCECVLVPMNILGEEIWPLVPDLVMLNYLRRNNESTAGALMDAGATLVVLDTEAGVLSPVPVKGKTDATRADTYAMTLPIEKAVVSRVAAFCAWTPKFRDYLVGKDFYRADQIAVTGTPRMDFYAEPWRRASREMADYAGNRKGPLLLINTTFMMCNPKFQTSAQEVDMMVNRFSYDREYCLQWVKTEIESLRALAQIVNHLARQFPDASVVVRPHPFENEETYSFLLDPLPNIHVVRKGTVDGWLLHAKAMIHCGSSTAIDAALAGVPAFAGSWLPLHVRSESVDAVTVYCRDLENLTASVGQALAGQFNIPSAVAANISGVVEDTFHAIDGQAHRRVADAVTGALKNRAGTTSRDSFRRRAYGVYPWKMPLRRRALALVRKALGLSVHWSFRHRRPLYEAEIPWDKTDKKFDAAGVQRMIDAIAAVAPAGSRTVRAQSAQEAGAYRYGYRQGRSVLMEAA